MPLIRPELWQLGLLLLSLPCQYILVQNWGNSKEFRYNALQDLFASLTNFHTKYLRLESWHRWCWELLSELHEGSSDAGTRGDGDPMGESPAVEVMKFKQKDGYFASSPEPRHPRPSHVKYRVGQVVGHKLWKYRGVIIGWDKVAQAPKEWLDEMHGSEKTHWREMPNYAILVDVRDRLAPQISYVPEENIEVIKNTRVMHPVLDDYFEKFDGNRYVPRPWLKSVYPHD